jgi:hypothetical protein
MNEGQKAIESFARLRSDLEKGQMQIDKALAAMDQLTTAADLEKSYKNFGKEVANVEKASGSARPKRCASAEPASRPGSESAADPGPEYQGDAPQRRTCGRISSRCRRRRRWHARRTILSSPI